MNGISEERCIRRGMGSQWDQWEEVYLHTGSDVFKAGEVTLNFLSSLGHFITCFLKGKPVLISSGPEKE